MLRNYLTIAGRSLWRNKGFSAINIFGLAIGIAACFFIFQYVYFESTYDRFHKNAENIYRVPISYSGSLADTPTTAANHPAVGPAMKADFPEVVDFVRVVSNALFMNSYTLSYKDANGSEKIHSEANMFLVDASFFKVFSYPLLSGDRKSCLTEPFSTVLSSSTAKKYFGETDPVGKILDMNGSMSMKVTGVFEDVPDNSHIKFDMLVSLSSIKPNYGYDNWTWPEFYTYVVLAPGTDVKKLEAKFPAFTEKYLAATMKELNFRSSFHLQSISDIHLNSNYSREAEVNGSDREIVFLSIIGAFILFIAWINYINLSTAKSMERAKEVGMRKVVGAEKSQLITQFMLESLFVNFLALAASFIIIVAFTPYFNDFIAKDVTTNFFLSGLGNKPVFWFVVLSVFLVGAVLVGAYPAFVMSSFIPVRVLKGLKINPGGISIRQILVSFQFVLSISLIALTVVVYQQFSFMRNGDLGYQKDQVVIVKAPVVKGAVIDNEYQIFKSDIQKLTSVNDATATSDIPGHKILLQNNFSRSNQDKQHSYASYLLQIDESFIPTYQIQLIAGQNLVSTDKSKMDSASVTKVLINEEMVKTLGFKSPQEAVNKIILYMSSDDGVQLKVTGVMKNFHQRSLKEKIDPILCYYPFFSNWKYLSVSLKANNTSENLSEVEKLYRKTFPGSPFEYFFLDEYFNRQYKADARLGNVFGLFSVLAIIVACLGLLGLSSFVIKLRTKEIGIRKVLGASVAGLLVLISKDFVKMVFIASLIAVPMIFYLANAWLDNFAFHITLGLSVFIIPPIILLALTLITICAQSLKTALTNPIKSLRSE